MSSVRHTCYLTITVHRRDGTLFAGGQLWTMREMAIRWNGESESTLKRYQGARVSFNLASKVLMCRDLVCIYVQ